MDFLSRFKNYGFWASVVAFVPILVQSLGLQIIPDQFNELTNAILTILVFLGILNNPITKSKWFLDDK